jgi:putative MATE family efflux protein
LRTAGRKKLSRGIMKDLTEGSVIRHLLHMASFMIVSMMAQTLYLLLDLYWVGGLGKEAIAAVGVAGNLMMIVLALTQMLGVGTTALISQAVGRKNQSDAQLTFNQSLVMAIFIGAVFCLFGLAVRDLYANAFSADAETASLAKAYLNWFVPALALQFPLVTLGSALRATGAIKPSVVLQVFSVVLNGVLAPFLIRGLGPFPRMGVSGAAVATFIAILAADIGTVIYFEKKYQYLRFRVAEWSPRLKMWLRMLKIGLPAGVEFILLSVYIGIIYVIIRPFGAAAQAGFGVGGRVMQAMFLPVVALSFAVSPVVGQNFGGRKADRVKHAVLTALGLATALMLILAALTWLTAPHLIRPFSKDANVIAFGSNYLNIVACNFIAAGIVFTSSSVFQGIGNTFPPLISSASRLFLFALPAWWVSRIPGFDIRYVWYFSVASQVMQACLILLLLKRELGHKLNFGDQPIGAEAPAF